LGTQKLPNGLDYPNFISQTTKNYNTYSSKQYLVYILEIPVFSPTVYQLYKLLPFPVVIKQEELTYGYIDFNKKLIFSDPLRQHYRKMTTNELTGCFQPN
jgi:hypothetical protein